MSKEKIACPDTERVLILSPSKDHNLVLRLVPLQILRQSEEGKGSLLEYWVESEIDEKWPDKSELSRRKTSGACGSGKELLVFNWQLFGLSLSNFQRGKYRREAKNGSSHVFFEIMHKRIQALSCTEQDTWSLHVPLNWMMVIPVVAWEFWLILIAGDLISTSQLPARTCWICTF